MNTDNISIPQIIDLIAKKKRKERQRKKLGFIDLFCGIGGIHQALNRLGCICKLACDIDKDCCKVYQKNYGIVPHSDVKTVDPNEMDTIDIICAGFPCQPFSKAGAQNGFKDDRGNIFFDICNIIE